MTEQFSPTPLMLSCARAAGEWSFRPEHKTRWVARANAHMKTYLGWFRKVPGFMEWWGDKKLEHAKRAQLEKDVYGTPEYSPTPLMVKLLETSIQDEFKSPASALCEEVGMSLSTYLGWRRNDKKFRAWWDQQVKEYFSASKPQVYAEIVGAAVAGNVNDRRLFLELFDESFVRKDGPQVQLTFEQAVFGAVRGFFDEGTGREASESGEVYSITVEGEDEGLEGRGQHSLPVQLTSESDSPRTEEASEVETAGVGEASQE